MGTATQWHRLAGSSWTSAFSMDSQKPSDASHEWRLPNVITSVASYKFCVKSRQGWVSAGAVLRLVESGTVGKRSQTQLLPVVGKNSAGICPTSRLAENASAPEPTDRPYLPQNRPLKAIFWQTCVNIPVHGKMALEVDFRASMRPSILACRNESTTTNQQQQQQHGAGRPPR